MGTTCQNMVDMTFLDNDASGPGGRIVHLRLKARNGKKSLTFVENIDPLFDIKKITGYLKKKLNCNGAIHDDEVHGQVIQFQGDFRRDIAEWLVKEGIVAPNGIRIHGA
eukprot:GDKJ01049461.1.p3 GENE.GDKJ01049461.1~~GDKJ01049461.1.p3  ORF type:complete len:109 (+),score=23.27 GDKJ01049461.1:469-795(+)